MDIFAEKFLSEYIINSNPTVKKTVIPKNIATKDKIVSVLSLYIFNFVLF